MKKLLSIILPFAFLAFSIAFGALVIVKHINNAESIKNAYDAMPKAYNEIPSVEFRSLDEYIRYVAEEALANDNASRTVQYYAPQHLPEGVEIINIRVNEEGTIFTYSLDNLPSLRDSILAIDTNDETVLELLHTARTKIYNVSNMTDKYLYAARLANAIGAVQCYPGMMPPLSATYQGYVKVNLQQNDGTYQQQSIGMQGIQIDNWGNIVYQYMPLNIPSSLAEQLELVPCSVTIND